MIILTPSAKDYLYTIEYSRSVCLPRFALPQWPRHNRRFRILVYWHISNDLTLWGSIPSILYGMLTAKKQNPKIKHKTIGMASEC